MPTLTQDWENGTNGAAVGTGSGSNTDGVGDSFIDSNVVGSGATQVLDNTHAAHGNLALKVATSGTSASSYVSWVASLGTQTSTVYFREYLYFTSNPSASVSLCNVVPGSGTGPNLKLTSSGTIQVFNGLTSLGTFTTAITLNAWVRVEFSVTPSTTAGVFAVTLYNTKDSVTATETHTFSSLNIGASVTGIRYGIYLASASVSAFWIDDIGVSTVGPLGPVVTAISGAAPLTGSGSLTAGGSVSGGGGSQTTVSFSTPGTHTWLCPANVHSIDVLEMAGADASGAGPGTTSGQCGGGGGAGAYGQWTSVAVVPGTLYTITVGLGGPAKTASAGTAGGLSSMVIATNTYQTNGGGAGLSGTPTAGGAGGAGGAAPTTPTPAVAHAGGSGAAGVPATPVGGAGGGKATPTGNGVTPTGQVGSGGGGSGGTAGSPNGISGTAGGGGGAVYTGLPVTSGAGTDGYVNVTYTLPTGAGFTLVQKSASTATGTGSVTPTLPGASTAGNLLVAGLANQGGQFSGPTNWQFVTSVTSSGGSSGGSGTPNAALLVGASFSTQADQTKKGNSLADYTWANSVVGPIGCSRFFYTGSLPASFVGDYGSDYPAGFIPMISYKTQMSSADLTAWCNSVNRDIVLIYHHEPEGDYTLGSTFVSEFKDQSDIVHQAGNAHIRFAVASAGYPYRNAGSVDVLSGNYLTGLGNISPVSGKPYADLFCKDIYQGAGDTDWPSNGLANFDEWLNWLELVTGANVALSSVSAATGKVVGTERPLGVTEYGIRQGWTGFSIAGRSARIELDMAYLQSSAFLSTTSYPLQCLSYWWLNNDPTSNLWTQFQDATTETFWSTLSSAGTAPASSKVSLWSYPNNPGGITSAAFTDASSGETCYGALAEFSGTSGAQQLIDSIGKASSGGGANLPVTAGSPNASGDLSIGVWANCYATVVASQTFGVPGGMTRAVSHNSDILNFWFGHQTGVASGTYAATQTYSDSSNVGWAGVIVTFAQSTLGGGVVQMSGVGSLSALGPSAYTGAGLVGTYFNSGRMGSGDFTTALNTWQTWTGIKSPVVRYYGRGISDFSMSTELTEMLVANCKVCMTLKPSFTSLNTTDLNNMEALLQQLQNMGANVAVTLYHEPFNNGLTASQYIAGVKYYGPTVRKYFPLAFIPGMGSVVNNNELSYYPGNAWIDIVGCDFYCTTYQNGHLLDPVAALADGASPPKPLTIWETGADVVGFNYLVQPDAGFEPASLGDWTGAGNSTIALSTVQSNSGNSSLAITSQAAGDALAAHCTAATIATNGMPCSSGDTITASAFFKAATATRSCQVQVSFFTAAGVHVSTLNGSSVTDSASVWTQATASVTAPATSAFCRAQVDILATGAAGEQHWVDDVALSDLATGFTTTQVKQYFMYIQNYFAGRLASGLINSDLLWFNSSGVNVNIIMTSGDFRLPLWLAWYNALSQPTIISSPNPAAATLTGSGTLTATWSTNILPPAPPGEGPVVPPSTDTPVYTYLATDLVSNTVLGELPLTGVTIDAQLNSAGNLAGTANLDDTQISNDEFIARTIPGKTAIWVYRNDQIVWGGIIWTRTWATVGKSFSITGQTFESYATKRFPRSWLGVSTFQYSQSGQCFIINNLWQQLQSVQYGNIGVLLQSTFPSDDILRDLVIDGFDLGTSFDSVIQTLLGFSDGPDYTITWSEDGNGNPVKQLMVWPKIGSQISTTQLEFDYPGNVKDYTLVESAASGANQWWAVGSGSDASTAVGEAIDSASLTSGWPLLESTNAFSDVTDIGTLNSYANTDLSAAPAPQETISVDLAGNSMPEFGTYAMGDYFVLNAVDPRFPLGITLTRRTIGWSVTPPDTGNGVEQVALVIDDTITTDTGGTG